METKTRKPEYVENYINFYDKVAYEEGLSKLYAQKIPDLIPEKITFQNLLEINNMFIRMTFNTDGTFSAFFEISRDKDRYFKGEGIFVKISDSQDKFDIKFLSIFPSNPNEAIISELTVSLSPNRKVLIFHENILFSDKLQLDSSFNISFDHQNLLSKILSQSKESSMTCDMFYRQEKITSNPIEDNKNLYFLSFLQNGDFKISHFKFNDDCFSINTSYGCFLEEASSQFKIFKLFKISYTNLNNCEEIKLFEETVEKLDDNKLKWNGLVFEPYEVSINQKIASIIGDELQMFQNLPKSYIIDLVILSELAVETTYGGSFNHSEKQGDSLNEASYNFYPNGMVKYWQSKSEGFTNPNKYSNSFGIGFYKRKDNDFFTHVILYSLLEGRETARKSHTRSILEESFKLEGRKLISNTGKVFITLV